MVTSAQALKKYGKPESLHNMVDWDVPKNLEIGKIPKSIYCNKDMVVPLSKAFTALIATGTVKELKTYDGCFNIRKKRGLGSMSLHSWGIAIDFNAAWNPLGGTPTFTPGFVKCFTDAGFEWGGSWPTRKDGMHFQLAKI
jgi:hypothetical protein